MADYINNVAAGDLYTDACTLGPNFDARYVVITVANNPALMQFAVGTVGSWRWTDEREFQSIPQSFRVGDVIGVRIRNAAPGLVARVLAVLAGAGDPDFQSGVPFSGVLAAGGGVTPGGGSVEVDHNGVAISTQPKLDLEDSGPYVWTVIDDPANTRATIALPASLVVVQDYLAVDSVATGVTAAQPGDLLIDFGPGDYKSIPHRFEMDMGLQSNAGNQPVSFGLYDAAGHSGTFVDPGAVLQTFTVLTPVANPGNPQRIACLFTPPAGVRRPNLRWWAAAGIFQFKAGMNPRWARITPN